MKQVGNEQKPGSIEEGNQRRDESGPVVGKLGFQNVKNLELWW